MKEDMLRPGKVIRPAEPKRERTPMAEDVKTILEGTLHILQLYTDIVKVLNKSMPIPIVMSKDIKFD